MIQILGLRYFKEKNRKYETFFDEQWRAPSVKELFKNIEKYIDPIPPSNRVNLFYTAAICKEEKGRKFIKQDIIPFDIDGADTSRPREYTEAIVQECLGLDTESVGVVCSGNGFQIIIGTDAPIMSVEYFDETRPAYNAICKRINETLKLKGLSGSADPSIWSGARLLRLPCTKNHKTSEFGYKNKNTKKEATLIQRVINPFKGLTIESMAKMTNVHVDDCDDIQGWDATPDNKEILETCEFLKFCENNPNKVSEENWYKMLSITANLVDGRKISHVLSRGYDGYDSDETETKIDQALESSGPRKCKNIAKSFQGCKSCTHYKKISSPIRIKSEGHIASVSCGFRKLKLRKDGDTERVGPDYDDLLKFYKKKNHYLCTSERIIYVYKNTHYEQEPDPYINEFCENHLEPKPTIRECSEFLQKVHRNNLIKKEWFHDTTYKKMNLKNGVLDLSGEEPIFVPHSANYGFTNTLPYEYNPSAKCPRFDKFMQEVTCGRQELIDVLLEFAGYAFANVECTFGKALMLLGEGQNGKSKFIELLQGLAGREAYSAVNIHKFNDEKYISMMDGKLFNVAGEISHRAFNESAVFKDVVTGGTITIRKLYKDPYVIANRTKIIVAMNNLPETTDTSTGMLRRMMIVPFDASFTGKKEDKNILTKLFAESSGILNRIIQGYQRLMANQNFTSSVDIEQHVKDYQIENNPVLAFFNECIEVLDEKNTIDFISTSDMFAQYKIFCERANIRNKLNSMRFGREVSKHIPECEKRKGRRQSGRVRGYNGLKIISDEGEV
jgi:P4 family phage/plasmid primase-like protien